MGEDFCVLFFLGGNYFNNILKEIFFFGGYGEVRLGKGNSTLRFKVIGDLSEGWIRVRIGG